MKRICLLLLLITSNLIVFSQSQRLVMVEHFTQASCGPCVQPNITIHNLMVQHPDKFTIINFHTSWPGVDPMNAHNPQEVAARVSLYGINYVPQSAVEGDYYVGAPTGWTNMNIINERYQVPSPFELSINQRISNDTIFVTMLVHATAEVTGPVSAYMGIIEKHIHFNNAPGSNGEKDFYNVFKKMLPTKTGIELPTPMSAGDYVVIESYWKMANVYNVDQLSVVSYLQNPTSKEMFQAGNMQEEPIEAVYENDAEITTVENMPEKMCLTSFRPQIKIRNNGNNVLQSMAIKYRINDGEFINYDWTGNLPLFKSESILLPEIDFTLEENNNLEVYIETLNGGDDDYTKNDTLIYEFTPSFQVGSTLELRIRTDNAPAETTWAIINSEGQTVASGGPYTETGEWISEEITISDDDCYDFYIYDAGGNGLCCGNGAGLFRLAPPSGNPIIAQGTTFGTSVTAQFEVSTVNTETIDINKDVKIFPNPASDRFTIKTSDQQSSDISITNLTGQVVYQTSKVKGSVEVSTDNWPVGIYVISVTNNYGESYHKMQVTR